MNEQRLKQLFGRVRSETPPPPPPNFEARVLADIRRELHLPAGESLSLWDQIGRLLSPTAVAAALVIGVCVAVDWHESAGSSSLTSGLGELSEQWMFAANGN